MANIVYIATSLDGSIARKDGGIDWLDAVPNPGQSDYGFYVMIDWIDAHVIGRKTYEVVLGFGSWPYTKPVFVISRTLAGGALDSAAGVGRAAGGDFAGSEVLRLMWRWPGMRVLRPVGLWPEAARFVGEEYLCQGAVKSLSFSEVFAVIFAP